MDSAQVAEAFKPYGKVLSRNMDTYGKVYVGVRNVLVDIQSPIPSQMLIAGHRCNVFYPGQPKTCFSWQSLDHDIKHCPNNTNKPASGSSNVGQTRTANGSIVTAAAHCPPDAAASQTLTPEAASATDLTSCTSQQEGETDEHSSQDKAALTSAQSTSSICDQATSSAAGEGTLMAVAQH